MPQNLINQTGPLPISAQFTTGSNGPATLIVAGSVWTKTQDRLIGVQVLLDGQPIGNAQIWSNAPSTHRAVVPMHFVIDLNKEWPSPEQQPSYKLTLQAMNSDTTSDQNDFFQVVLNA